MLALLIVAIVRVSRICLVLVHSHEASISLVLDYLLHGISEVIKVHLIWLLDLVLLYQLRVFDPPCLVHGPESLELRRILQNLGRGYNLFLRLVLCLSRICLIIQRLFSAFDCTTALCIDIYVYARGKRLS